MAVTPARRAALATLRAVARGRRLDLAFDHEVGGLPPRDRRWVHEAVYGVQRLRGRLDHLLARQLRSDLADVKGPLLDVLRLGAYQLLYMDSVPPYAAVSQSVEQAKALGGGRSGAWANAVLRRVADEGAEPSLFPDAVSDPAGWLSTWGSHPRWLVERWLARWTVDEVTRLVEQDNRPPPLTVVPLTPESEAVELLRAAGIEARPVGWGSGALEIAVGVSPAEVLERLPAWVQDAAAALVVSYADPPPDAVVADLCAAPGGKALALARRAAYVLAADRSLPRLRVLRSNLRRTGSALGIVQAVAERPPLREAPFALLDVPCSGTGTLRRHPDARWRLDPAAPARLAEVQRRMLDGVAPLVPPGGVLVYSTCTLEPEENEEQVARFLSEHPEFRVESTGSVDAALLDEGRLVVLPQRTGFDGAFGARLVRRRPGVGRGTGGHEGGTREA